MLELLKYLKGYLYIEISGNYPERFFNVCAANRIKLWDYNKKGKKLYAKMYCRDYLNIRPIKRRCDVSLKIASRHGLPTKIKPYNKRYGMLVGFFVYSLLIFVLTNYIWSIEINGNKSLSKDEILRNCKSIGVYEGVYKKSINCEESRHRLILKNGDICWASFIIEGSHLTVNISETKKAEKTDTSLSNLIAIRDGIVEKIEIKRGMPTVKVNQAVLKGDILASGTMQYADGSTHFVNSSGKVIAKTKRTHTITIPMYIKQKKYTGVTETRYKLRFFGVDIPISFKPINCTADKKLTEIKLMCNSSYVPIYLTQTKFKEYKYEKVKLSNNEMLSMAKKQLKEYEKNELKEVTILSYNDDIEFKENQISVARQYVCRENIAKIEKIKINTVN